MPSNPDSSRQQTQEYWRDRVKAARIKYDLSIAESRRVLKEQKDWPFPEPDGSSAVRNSRLAESSALNEYMRALRTFTDLTLHGKMPKDP